MRIFTAIWLFGTMLLIGCCSEESEKYITGRENVVNVEDRLKFIDTDLMVGPVAKLSVVGDYLIIADPNSMDNLINIFSANDYSLLCSRVKRGRGPRELTRMGDIAVAVDGRSFLVPDFGKHAIFRYNVDFLCRDDHYSPTRVCDLPKSQFPSTLTAIDAENFMGTIIEPVGTGHFNQSVGVWNMARGEVRTVYSGHPQLSACRVCYDLSLERSIVAIAHHHHDLMVITDIEGNLKYNIYGPKWAPSASNREYHYGKVVVCDDMILASYSGGKNDDEGRAIHQIIVYDLKGNYIHTLDTGISFEDFCFNRKNNNLIFILNDERQLAYLEFSNINK